MTLWHLVPAEVPGKRNQAQAAYTVRTQASVKLLICWTSHAGFPLNNRCHHFFQET